MQINIQDITFILNWFLALFAIGIIFLPTSFTLFSNFKDKGYIFSKTIGLGVITYLIFILSLIRLTSFNIFAIISIMILCLFINYFIILKNKKTFLETLISNYKLFIFEEILLIIGIIFWSFIRSNSPDINGLEKFMDFGFLNSILRSEFFPPKDMWYSPYPINYYYFGHLITAVLTKLTLIPSYISYNLMISTLFSLTFLSTFSLGINLFHEIKSKIKQIISGLLISFIVTFGGNLTTIYTFFKQYTPPDSPVPFWKLNFLPLNFPNDYWYPNATRFIPFTIHEFPLYSFVVSDLHGHVLDIPFVLLIIALTFSVFSKKLVNLKLLIIFSFILSIMYMTNAWDSAIYMLLVIFIILLINLSKNNYKILFTRNYIYQSFKNILILISGFLIFSLPFNINFKPFVSGIGILCAPNILTKFQKIGPFLFESNHRQKSPIWQLMLLYGFFYFFVVAFVIFLKQSKNYKITKSDIFILVISLLSTFLIIVPEFVYIKDIYPMHYRANTMFKLTYESFIMLSISSGYIICKILTHLKNKIYLLIFFVFTFFQLFFIFLYPVFAINSYYKNLNNYTSLNGFKYMKLTIPEDFELINWINKNIKNQPIILEASGDSYTDYARISANTGLPTVIGWTVHEWLWRGTYDIVSPRIIDVENLYTSNNISLTKNLIKKYNISYVVISSLEKRKYPSINEEKFKSLGKIVFKNNLAVLYKINFEALR